MRNAPSVVYPVGRCRFYAGMLVVLGLVCAGALLAWWWPLLFHGPSSPVHPPSGADRLMGLLGVSGWLAWVGFAVYSWRHSPTGVLQWDAQGGGDVLERPPGVWRWRSAAYRDGTPLQQVSLALDLQGRMLLRLRNTDAAHTWVWVEQGSDPQRWLDLRRALVATRA